MGSACSCATKADVIETEGFVRYAPEPEPETRQQDFDLELCNGVGTVKTVEYFGGPLNPVTREKSFAKRSKARRGSFKAQHASPNTPGAWAAHAVDPLGSPKPDLLVRLRSRSEAWITSTASAAWARLNAWVRDLEVPDKHVIAVSVLGLLCMFGIAAALFVIGFQLTWGQAVNSGNGVTVFYNVLTCPPREVAAGGRLNNSNVSFLFSVQYAQTDDDSCGSMFSSLFPETVSEGPQFGAPSPPPLPPDNSLLESELGAVVSDREHHLVIMLREDDGYERGASYVPVVLLGPNHYAFIQFSILDALRREVYREVTLQLGPDEHYPWSTNDTTKDLDESDWAEEDWVEDVFEDLGEDLFENLIDKVADVAEDVAEDLLDPLDDVPEAYYGIGGQDSGGAETISPPFYFGPAAVSKGTPIVMVTEEHYRVRQDFMTSDGNARCKGIQCQNISSYRPTEPLDRYELVPAAALLTPISDVRWPLQLRIQSAAVYSRRSAEPQPLLLSFNKLGFEPDYAAYSDREGEWEEYKGRRGTPKFLVLIVVVAVVSLLCVVCNRVSTVLSDVRGGESPMHGDEDDESPDVSSPDVSPHGSPIMSRAMQIMAGKTPKADRGTAERDPDSAAAGATAGSALLDLQPPKLVLSGSSPAAPAAAAAAAAVTSSSKAAASGQASGSVVTFSSSSTSSDKRSQELL